ncbi:dTDP-glucose 4,6-dehydratase [Sphaerisporangium rufum]|uniref:dTDP-glucose 4,6-dehydratase n=1 Tax=Sphaerisporangium rufum TaxID=1381558 RepID=A0A919RBQ2_9ACTN|nr:dTDP-glucose 4,6-dehydratase [Sphaerisporangium rufum]GII81020.1 dTDP-glucose 4,6-dehydratase [Sphaerisporangium rufum]
MRILVTGGAGFIGSHYVRSLLDDRYAGCEGAQVTVLDKLTYAGTTANLPMDHRRLTFVRGDVCDRDLLMDLLPGHDAVVHFAAESHVDRSITDPDVFVRTNVLGTQNLADCCLHRGVERILHVSTDEVYGSIAEGTWSEDTPLSPSSPYSASKAGSDLIMQAYFLTHGLPVCITRCSNNYGPHQFPEKIIPLFVTNLLSGRDVPLYGDGQVVREWLHVDDHCRGIDLVLAKGRPGEVYHLGQGTEVSNLALTERLLELCGAGPERVRRVADRKGHDRRYSLNGDKARRELGYEARVPFEDGLAETVRWYRENPDWWRALRPELD